MTVKYTYKCSGCNHNYIEQRLSTESQFFTTCNSCGEFEYIEISSETIEESTND